MSDNRPAPETGPGSRSRGTRLPHEPDGRDWLTVTSPLLPDADRLCAHVREILDSNWVTNQGRYARRLESELARYLDVERALVITNATVALEMSFLESIEDGEVIVPAYSFPATWNLFFENPRFTPVFVDIGEDFRIDPAAVEAAISPRTRAVVAVHTYGFLCDHAALATLCSRHDLRLIYDAAHAFGVYENGVSAAVLGDLNIFSFHATKVYNTLEGGAITGDADLLDGLMRRRNFGLSREEQFRFGTNGKIDELRAAVGLLNLEQVDDAIRARSVVSDFYLEALPAAGLDMLQLYPEELRRPGVRHNHAYFPVRIRPEAALSRDELLEALKQDGILARRYFYPTPTTSALYPEVHPEALPRTNDASLDTLCLPLHHRMTPADCDHVVASLRRALCA